MDWSSDCLVTLALPDYALDTTDPILLYMCIRVQFLPLLSLDIIWLDLTLIISSNTHTHTHAVRDCLFVPESVQSPLWTLPSSRQELHSWLSWMIVAQVQLSQMGGVRSQSWGQRRTAFLCDQTAWQPGNVHHITHISSSEGTAKVYCSSTKLLTTVHKHCLFSSHNQTPTNLHQ